MKYWIDKDSESNNVICISNTAILIASCDKEHQQIIAQQLDDKVEPSDIFGADDIQSVPLIQVQTIISRSTDTEIDVGYKAKKDLEEVSLDFGTSEAKQEALKVFGIILPDNLEKKIYQQSRQVAAIAPLLTLLSMSLISYLFINKFRWPVIIIGGIAIIASLYMTYSRLSNPPEITRWALKGKYTRKAIGKIKTGFSYLVAAAVVLGIWAKFPDSYGEKSLYVQMQNDDLKASDVKKYVDRGADINYLDEDGETPLAVAIGWGENDLAIAIIEAGAELNSPDSEGHTPLSIAIYNGAEETLIRSLLKHGADSQIKIDGQTLAQYSLEAGEDNIALLLNQQKTTL